MDDEPINEQRAAFREAGYLPLLPEARKGYTICFTNNMRVRKCDGGYQVGTKNSWYAEVGTLVWAFQCAIDKKVKN